MKQKLHPAIALMRAATHRLLDAGQHERTPHHLNHIFRPWPSLHANQRRRIWTEEALCRHRRSPAILALHRLHQGDRAIHRMCVNQLNRIQNLLFILLQTLQRIYRIIQWHVRRIARQSNPRSNILNFWIFLIPIDFLLLSHSLLRSLFQ